ncbi:hypothetical protein RB596_004698 [Gaeumannomyces avenae]
MALLLLRSRGARSGAAAASIMRGGSLAATAAFSHSARAQTRLRLAFDHHEPARPVADAKTSPILFLHGLFGSKKNNRSIKLSPVTWAGTSMSCLPGPEEPRRLPPRTAARLPGHGRRRGRLHRGAQPPGADADRPLHSLPVRQFLLGNLHRSADGDDTQKFRVPLSVLAKALDHMGDFPYKNPDEARFNKRALFVRGTKSKYVADEALPIVGQFFPRFELVDIDAGHWLISEKPEEFRQAVVRFLDPKERE